MDTKSAHNAPGPAPCNAGQYSRSLHRLRRVAGLEEASERKWGGDSRPTSPRGAEGQRVRLINVRRLAILPEVA